MSKRRWQVMKASLVVSIAIVLGVSINAWRSEHIAKEKFASVTKLPYPDSAEIISVGYWRVHFHSDSEFHLVMAVPREVIDSYLRQRPFHGTSWRRGPVPAAIRIYPRFGTDGYLEDDYLTAVMDSDAVFYAAEGLIGEGGEMHWGNGCIIIIDYVANKVWLSVWDT